MTLFEPARAKLNLDLRVLERLPDGRHGIASRMQAIDLADDVQVSRADRTKLEPSGLAVPGDVADNLAVRAVAALEAATGRDLPVRIELEKKIPAGAGLGGGSSDAATVLRLVSALYEVDVDLRPIAATLGADVPFFLCGGAADASGAGDELEPRAIDEAWYVVAWPGFGVSTAAVYAKWDEVGGDGDNQLQRPATACEPRLAEFAARLGAGWQMTGSGTAFFARLPGPVEARRAAALLDCWHAIARPVRRWC